MSYECAFMKTFPIKIMKPRSSFSPLPPSGKHKQTHKYTQMHDIEIGIDISLSNLQSYVILLHGILKGKGQRFSMPYDRFLNIITYTKSRRIWDFAARKYKGNHLQIKYESKHKRIWYKFYLKHNYYFHYYFFHFLFHIFI